MKDLLYREINIGDVVIGTVRKYERLGMFKVTRLTKKCAFCEPLNPEKLPSYSREGMLKTSEQICKFI